MKEKYSSGLKKAGLLDLFRLPAVKVDAFFLESYTDLDGLIPSLM